MNQERLKANRYACERVANAVHLVPSLPQARIVWVMGHLACNAVANASTDFPKERRKISQNPYPGPIAPGSRFFVSEYFRRFTKSGKAIFEAFARFARQNGF